jgi:hypothetical protein
MRQHLIGIMLTFSGTICAAVSAQNSVGATGLIHIPTAEMQPAGTLMLGGGSLPRQMIPNGMHDETDHHYYVNFTMFPFLETALNFTLLRLHGARHYNNQDRSGSVRLLLWRQEWCRFLPQVVVGSNSLLCEGGSSWWQAYYAVITRRWESPRYGMFSLTAGYYFPWGDYRSYYGRSFGGVAWRPVLLPPHYEKIVTATLIAEYDSHQINYGLRACLWNRWSYTAAWTRLHHWTWQLCYRVHLSL